MKHVSCASSAPARLSNRVELFGVEMDALTMDQTTGLIDQRIQAGQFTQHVVVNVAKLVKMQSDPDLAGAVRACEIINIDGAGIVFGGRLLGLSIPERVAGIDLFERLLAHAALRGWSVYLLGAQTEVLEMAVANIRLKHPSLQIAGFHHGYFWDDERAIVRDIRNSGAHMLFVGIGSPLKEQFINRWRNEFGVLFAMGVGGTFDVVAGKVRRAPLWMQGAGLEWLYRVLQEPRRMWKRYLVTNVKFATMLIREKWKLVVRGKPPP